ncbi:HEPN domain-containing protein [Photobacterium rosenbergii]|uniref:ApeA N-terminal domain-containing protein n=1 Tax=Photobacterium rosenbergii TaxID=294936 RepID=A0ABU3ZHX7_9GAMM|nr:HEPN domain-containing protein [Photobacterium rosenbergii]MDV5169717.1 hypothetical protein [Photobacterium rosenbergii]
MDINEDTLDLYKNYEVNVTLGENGNRFAGTLTLTPKAITLKVMGETREGRSYPDFWNDVDKLICNDINKTFILHNLRATRGVSRAIDSYPENIGYFEREYSVDFVVFVPTDHFYDEKCFNLIDIKSKSISRWIGTTKKQQKIIDIYGKRESIFESGELLNQLSLLIDDGSYLSISYNLSTHFSSPEFSAGLSFPPSLTLYFNKTINSSNIKSKYDEIYTLLAFFISNDFEVERITLGYDFYGRKCEGMLYFPVQNTLPKHDQGYDFFPLGVDLAFDSLCLPEVSTNYLNNYFCMDNKHKGHFHKFLKYRRLQNPEEQFLGFFRILESLCYKTKNHLDSELLSDVIQRSKPYLKKKFKDTKGVNSFLRGLPRYNQSKYNTEKCLQDFYTQIPTDTSDEWSVSKNDIASVCRLRNDLTHANDFYIEEHDLYKKTKFIEVLLVIAMGMKLDIPVTDLCSVIHRLPGYHIITK